ncbi:MAG: hypothetical protein H6713_23775 [Myxococcales bacterium]|nr:hypothetical protein [Myxococcales bacterium]
MAGDARARARWAVALAAAALACTAAPAEVERAAPVPEVERAAPVQERDPVARALEELDELEVEQGGYGAAAIDGVDDRPPPGVTPAERARLREETGFPEPPLGDHGNCTEYRGALQPVRSSKHLVSQLRRGLAMTTPRRQPVRALDSFREPPPARVENGRLIGAGPVRWDAVTRAIAVHEEGGVTYYTLEYTPFGCGVHTLRATSTGFAALDACCGK